MMFIGKYLLPKDSGTLNLEIDEEILENETSTQKQIICGIIMVGVIGSMATGIVPLEIAAVVGAVIAVLTGCLTENKPTIPLTGSPSFFCRYDSGGDSYEYQRRR